MIKQFNKKMKEKKFKILILAQTAYQNAVIKSFQSISNRLNLPFEAIPWHLQCTQIMDTTKEICRQKKKNCKSVGYVNKNENRQLVLIELLECVGSWPDTKTVQSAFQSYLILIISEFR